MLSYVTRFRCLNLLFPLAGASCAELACNGCVCCVMQMQCCLEAAVVALLYHKLNLLSSSAHSCTFQQQLSMLLLLLLVGGLFQDCWMQLLCMLACMHKLLQYSCCCCPAGLQQLGMVCSKHLTLSGLQPLTSLTGLHQLCAGSCGTLL
jgi:hypothetical protein